MTHRLRDDGTRCEFDGTTVALGAPSYPVDAIGEAGAPDVTPGDRSLVREIRRDAPHLRLLRFTYLHGGFIVFDASSGPCSPEPERVLNQGCNAFYRPGEAGDDTIAAPSCLSRPRPWIMGDGGEPSGPAWNVMRDGDGQQFITGWHRAAESARFA